MIHFKFIALILNPTVWRLQSLTVRKCEQKCVIKYQQEEHIRLKMRAKGDNNCEQQKYVTTRTTPSMDWQFLT